MTRPNAFIDWSVAAAADFTSNRLKPRVRKNTAFVLREQTAYLGSFECMYIQHDFDIN